MRFKFEVIYMDASRRAIPDPLMQRLVFVELEEACMSHAAFGKYSPMEAQSGKPRVQFSPCNRTGEPG
jgi:hypothetical protein